MSLSYGQKKVGVDFNPSQMTEVDGIKQKCAELIDKLRKASDEMYRKRLKRKGHVDEISITIANESVANAVTALEVACMSSVKALVLTKKVEALVESLPLLEKEVSIETRVG